MTKLRHLKEEGTRLGSGRGSERDKEIEELRHQLKHMQKETKKLSKEKDRRYEERLEELDKRYSQLEHGRYQAIKEVETGSGNVGEALIGGIMTIGKLAWKGIQMLF